MPSEALTLTNRGPGHSVSDPDDTSSATAAFDAMPRHRLDTKIGPSVAVNPIVHPVAVKVGKPVQEASPAFPINGHWIIAWSGQRGSVIPVEEVLYFQSDSKYTRVVTAGAQVLIRKSLRDLERELDPQMFWPIHRSTLVNAHAITGLERDDRGRIFLRVKTGGEERLVVSAAHSARFRSL